MEINNIYYKRASLEDMNTIAKIESETFSIPWSKQALTEAYSDEKYLFISAYKDGRLVGYLVSNIIMDECNIITTAVAGGYRNNGIGNGMFEYFDKQIRKLNVTNIYLEVRTSNIAAIKLYTNQKFESMGIRKGFYEFPKEDALIMMKKM